MTKRHRKRQTLSEAEHYSGKLLVMETDAGAGIFWCSGISFHTDVGIHYRACCLIEETRSIESATQGAEMIDDGLRLPPDTTPCRTWAGFTGVKDNGKKKTRSILKSIA